MTVTVPKIVVNVDATGHGTVSVDGVELNCVSSVNIWCRAGEITRVSVTFAATDVVVNAEKADLTTEVKEPL